MALCLWYGLLPSLHWAPWWLGALEFKRIWGPVLFTKSLSWDRVSNSKNKRTALMVTLYWEVTINLVPPFGKNPLSPPNQPNREVLFWQVKEEVYHLTNDNRLKVCHPNPDVMVFIHGVHGRYWGFKGAPEGDMISLSLQYHYMLPFSDKGWTTLLWPL